MPVITASTQVYCIIGQPVRHSFSPAIQNAAFTASGIDAVYTAFEVGNVPGALAGIRALGIKGASVTIPHKEAVMPHLDEIDDLAKMIGSVNTLINRGDKLFGANTDAYGFYRALSEKTPVKDKRVAVFGSGGSAKAILFALFYFDQPAQVTLFARNETARKAMVDNIIAHLPAANGKIEALPLSEWGINNGRYDILVNTTPIGMSPNTDECVISTSEIPANTVVMDIVYRSHQTRLLKAAQEMGCTIVHGVDMLLYQGMKQFELWTGQTAPESVMREALQKALNR